MGEAEDSRRVADQLCEVTFALENVDLNPMLDDQVRDFLDAKDVLSEICLHHRRHQRTVEKWDDPSDEDHAGDDA